MTRWFYTDPLAAAWMAKHFGMRLIHRSSLFPDRIGSEVRPGLFGCTEPNAWLSTRFAIHPESLSLLEPQLGDLVQNPDGLVATVAEHPLVWGEVEMADAKEYVGTAATIIQRDGKPFHWPDSEAV